MAMANITEDPYQSNYSYDLDYDDEICNREDVGLFGATFTPVFFSIVIMLSLFGNTLVIVILALYENLKSLTNALILNLAVSDLLLTSGLPFWAYYDMYGWTLGEPACKTVHFVFYVGFYSSGILLILMTMHRYIAVMYPLSNIVSTKGLCSLIVSASIWVLSMLAASPAFIFTEIQKNKFCEFTNSYWTLWGIYQQNFLFILSSVVFIVCYSQIMRRLLRPTGQRKKSKTIKLIFTLIVVFFLGWAPYNIVIFLLSSYYSPKSSVSSEHLARNCNTYNQLNYAFYVTRFFAFSHCCLNPVFYVFVGIKFKSHLKKMLKSWGHKKGSIRSRSNRPTITSHTSGEEFSM